MKRIKALWFAGAAFVPCALAPAQHLESVIFPYNPSKKAAGGLSVVVTDDGNEVVFISDSGNLVAGDTNKLGDVFMRDRAAATTTRLSVASDGTQADDVSIEPDVIADGSLVVFSSHATNLVSGDTNSASDIFLRDVLAATTTRISIAYDGSQAGGDSYEPRISADGRFVTFFSNSSNLVPNDWNGWPDIFVRDLVTGTNECVSIDPSGGVGNRGSYNPAISGDGRYVAFDSDATNLVTGDANGWRDIFIRDRLLGITYYGSVAYDGSQANADCSEPSISRDGMHVAFQTGATNLDPSDNAAYDIYARDLQLGINTRVSVTPSGGSADDENDDLPHSVVPDLKW